MADRNGRRLAALVDDLLDLQRIASGTLKTSPQPVDFACLLRDILDQHAPCAQSRGVRLVLAEAPAALPGRVDTMRFAQMVGNLLANAIEFSPADAPVEVRLLTTGPDVRVAVTDRGPGIPAHLHGRIFERFVQADTSDRRARQGSGLGLAIVRELAELLGGSVGLESTPGKGSTFTLVLPRFPSGGRNSLARAEDQHAGNRDRCELAALA